MSVNYSSSIGYGYAVIENDAGEYLKSFEPYEDGPIPDIMETAGWDLIGYDQCGNMMSDESVYLFYIKGTEVLHASIEYDLEIIVEFGDSDAINTESVDQLESLAEHFGLTGNMGWKLISNVS